MRADLILGFDPVPADQTGLASLSDGLRTVIRALVEARLGLEQLGRIGSVWDGPAGAPVATLLRRYSQQLSALEEPLVDCLRVVDVWRDGSEERQGQVAEIVEAVAELAGQPDSDERRTRLIATATEIGLEHERSALDLANVFQELSVDLAQIVRADDDLAGELDRALTGLAAAVDEWMTVEAPELLGTAIALGEVAGLTTVISELVGIAALGRNPGDAEGVGAIIARSPASHRLVRALRRQWSGVASGAPPVASFATPRTSELAAALAGRPSHSAGAPVETPDTGERVPPC